MKFSDAPWPVLLENQSLLQEVQESLQEVEVKVMEMRLNSRTR